MMTARLLLGCSIAAALVNFAGCAHPVPLAAKTPPPVVNQTPSTPVARASTPQATQRPVEQPVTTSSSRMPDAATRATIHDLLNRIQDAYFDYDKHSIRPDAQAALQKDANTLTEILKQYPNYKLTVEGYCDERGSEQYNLALGDARAQKAKEYLATLGIPADQLRTVSYGKERPVCFEHDEDCWQKNRRAHVTQAE
jgi:peptidoglycan-associated lipoprotein